MTVDDDLSKVIHELESGLLGLGQKYPEIRQGMEDVANLIAELHGHVRRQARYIRTQDDLIAEMKCVLESTDSLLGKVARPV